MVTLILCISLLVYGHLIIILRGRGGGGGVGGLDILIMLVNVASDE